MQRTFRLGVLGLCLGALQCQAADPVVHGAAGAQYAPYSDPSLPAGGLAAEIVQRALALQHVGVDNAWLPWRRVETETAEGHYQLAWPFVRNPERERQFLYSAPLYMVSSWLFAREGDPLLAKGKLSLAGRTLCLPTGYSLSGEVRQALQGTDKLNVQSPPSLHACAQMVAIGRADFFFASVSQFNEIASSLPPQQPPLGRSALPLTQTAVYAIFPRQRADSAALLKLFQ